MTIKDEETCRMVREVAEFTGDSLTGVVLAALRNKIAHQRELDNMDAILAEIDEITKGGIENMKPGPSAADHGDWLYDENGLPK